MPSFYASKFSLAALMLNLWRWLGALVVALAAPKTWAAGAATAATAGVAATAATMPVLSQPACRGVGHYLTPALASSYPLAFLLSSLWPWLVPVAMDKFKSWAVPSTQGTGEN